MSDMTPTPVVSPTPLPERPRARHDVVFRPLGEQWVLYDPSTRKLHVLNVTAALVWALCDGEHGRDGMADSLAETLTHAPQRPQLLRDVESALDRFHTEGLVQ